MPQAGTPIGPGVCPSEFVDVFRDLVTDWDIDSMANTNWASVRSTPENRVYSPQISSSGNIARSSTDRGFAYKFNGSQTYDDPETPTFTGEYTISLVCSWDATPSTVFGGNSANNRYALFVSSTYVFNRPHPNFWRGFLHGSIALGQVVHFMVTRDGSNIIRFYRDGKFLGVDAGGALSGTADVKSLTGYQGSRVLQHNGKINQFAMWRRCFTTSQVMAHMASPFGHRIYDPSRRNVATKGAGAPVSVPLHNLTLLGVGS
jgi:hypothetical protein